MCTDVVLTYKYFANASSYAVESLLVEKNIIFAKGSTNKSAKTQICSCVDLPLEGRTTRKRHRNFYILLIYSLAFYSL